MTTSLYLSLAHALGESRSHLVRTDSSFRKLLKHVKKDLKFHKTTDDTRNGKPAQHNAHKRLHGYALLQTSGHIHHSRKGFPMNRTLRREIRLIRDALSSNWIDPWRPIGHRIPRDPSGSAWSDSSLDAAGGFSYELGFWWYLKWPENIRQHTLKFVASNKDGNLVTINTLEYASLIINYIAATHVLVHVWPSTTDPYPTVLLYAYNTVAKSWMKKSKHLL